MVNNLNQKKRFVFLLISMILVSVICMAQSEEEIKEIFLQAESYYIYEEYELAKQLYMLIDNPDNMNVKYKIGSCYLSIADEKEKSISYLIEAAGKISSSSNPDSFKESAAPLDLYFFLAKAYMINNEFELAISMLEKFKTEINDNGDLNQMENVGYIEQLISACNNAIQFRNTPINFSKEMINSDIVGGAMNENATVSYDGETLVYTEKMGIENTIFFSKKINGEWTPAVAINSDLKAGTDCSSCSLNSDGTEMYLYKTDNYDGSIYTSTYNNGKWTPIKKLNKNINTKYFESHASISFDGKKLFFTSNRPGGQGNLDIYVSERDKKGNWFPAINLGSTINTPFNEDTPFITQNDSILFFSSEGHNSMGGYDIFKSNLSGSEWQYPLNIGYPINSADDDKFLQPINNGLNFYFSMTTDYKRKGIFYLTFNDLDSARNNRVFGHISLERSIDTIKSEQRISIVDGGSLDTLYNASTDSSFLEYSIDLPTKNFHANFLSTGYYPVSIDTIIGTGNEPDRNIFDIVLLRDTTIQKSLEIEPTDIPIASTDSDFIPLVEYDPMVTDGIMDLSVPDSSILYYTVQVMALHNPVDISYFRFVDDIRVSYDEIDRFYRYQSGRFVNKSEANVYRSRLINNGYPDQIFVKKIY